MRKNRTYFSIWEEQLILQFRFSHVHFRDASHQISNNWSCSLQEEGKNVKSLSHTARRRTMTNAIDHLSDSVDLKRSTCDYFLFIVCAFDV